MKIIKKLTELTLFVFSGILVRISFSGALDYITNAILFSGAIIILIYVVINQILDEQTKEKIAQLKWIINDMKENSIK